MSNKITKGIFFYLLLNLLLGKSVSAIITTSYSQSPVQLTASVPGYWRLELTGWTSPYATVSFTMAQRIKVETNADSQGKFTFVLILPRKLDPFCLVAKDIAGTTSHPLCITPPPPDVDILVKEVVMPPTINILRGDILRGETIAAQGYTTPNSEVSPFLFQEQNRSSTSGFLSQIFNFSFGHQFLNNYLHIPKVYAAELPKAKVISDNNGFYQFNLPTTDLGKNRIFIGSYFLNNPSPKSNILVFNILTYWQEVLLKIISFLSYMVIYLLNFFLGTLGIIILEVFAVILLLIFLLRKKKNRALYLNPERALMEIPKTNTKVTR